MVAWDLAPFKLDDCSAWEKFNRLTKVFVAYNKQSNIFPLLFTTHLNGTTTTTKKT